ncbi:MAG: aryl sulfotransferase [Deltaproteobacteria bacterium]|nr:aryl sulfotransferase [Deltaproteobacteria bacterium]
MLHYKTGLITCDESRATPGYTLFWPLNSTTVHLINMRGMVVHEWHMPGPPGNYAYLLPNGNLLAAIRTKECAKGLAAKGGLMQELDWDGTVLWEYIDHWQHHDFRRRPNGTTIYIGWELLPEDTAQRVRGGVKGTEHEDGIYGDFLREVDPQGQTVWEWHASTDQEIEKYPICPLCDRREFAHANTVFPLPNGDVMVSWRQNHLIATIDRKTKAFKWEMCDWILGHQHDVQMLENGHVLVFANGCHAPWHGTQEGSRIFEIDPKDNRIVWQYVGNPPYTFDSSFISGVQRLDSGNTLICEGRWGRIFEITPEGDVVWDYVSPYFQKDPPYTGGNYVFRAYRYGADSPEIARRLDSDPYRP